jgi:uncharacterized protein involved in type VI secretion and phage assembly
MTIRLFGEPEPEDEEQERRIYGVAPATVVSNVDEGGEGQVQVRFPWLPGIEPCWARVAVLTAGKNRGTFFMPQENDEVLVAFHHGDIREPYIIGSLWNSQDTPPAKAPKDAQTKWLIRTPKGHEIVLDDEAQTITIRSKDKQRITVGPAKIEIATDENKATVTLDKNGTVSIQAQQSLELKADTIKIEGKTVDIKGSVSAKLDGGQDCTIKGGFVRIN